VAINAFVGGVVGVERSTLAPLAGHDFHLASRAAILSFLISFGLVKAASNFVAGGLADRFGRRTVLLVGWGAALPVPVLIILAPSWGWVVFANVLLGVNQGLAWSTTVNMKIDLVGPERRGFALGLNEVTLQYLRRPRLPDFSPQITESDPGLTYWRKVSRSVASRYH